MYLPNAAASSSTANYHAPPPLAPHIHHSQPRFYHPPTPTSAPVHHQAPYIPRVTSMDNFGLPPSPASQFSPDEPVVTSSYAPTIGGSAILPSRAYMSPQLPHLPQLSGQFDGLSTHSPAILHNQSIPGQPGPSSDRQYVTVHEWGPAEGVQGTQVTIKCDVNIPLTTPSNNPDGSSPDPSSRAVSGKALRVVFGTHPVPTAVHIVPASGQMHGGQVYQLTAAVPSYSSTGGQSMGYGGKVHVFVEVLEEKTFAIVSSVPLGEFSYASASGRSDTLKRAGDSLESSRPSPSSLHRRVMSNSSVNYGTPELQQYPTMSSTYNPSPSGRSVADSTGSWQSPYMGSSSTVMPAVPQPAPPPYTPGMQPSLMRSTQVGPPGIAVTPTPYVNSGQKACLELQGDLNIMSKQWSQEEWHSRRRLVQFWRRQDGTTIHAAFAPLSQADYPANQQAIIISCIFREDKNACFVTSVDAIYLLEALVGTRFTVEEKNRIRRNLEGFRPITVSKSKPGSEDFFRLIMNFPNPRPRNIEKDVKVFPWEILGAALKKIIGKYSASFPTPSSSSCMPPPPAPMPMQVPPHFSAPPPTSSMLPPAGQEDDYGSYSSSSVPPPSGSAPHLSHHSSSDSATSFAQSSAYSHPETPQTHGSPTAYRTVSSSTPHGLSHSHNHPSEEKHYLNLSPGYAQGGAGPWATTNADPHDGAGVQPSYGGGVGIGYPDQPHQLPHLHQSLSRHPSSNDLRVIYPGMAS